MDRSGPSLHSSSSPWIYDVVTEHAALTTTGGRVWPAANRLAEYLEHELHDNPDLRQPVSVLELGSGCGWLGLVLARNLPPSLRCMCVTEQEEGGGLAWLQHNVQLNMGRIPGVERVLCLPCDWNDYVPAAPPATASAMPSQQQLQQPQQPSQCCCSGGGSAADRRKAVADCAKGGSTPEASGFGTALQQNAAANAAGKAQRQDCSAGNAAGGCSGAGNAAGDAHGQFLPLSAAAGPMPPPVTASEQEPSASGSTPGPSADAHATCAPHTAPGHPASCSNTTDSQLAAPSQAVGRLCPVTGAPWDLILGSDLIYTEGGCRMLPEVIRQLATPGHTHMLYCHTRHRFDYLDLLLMEEFERCGLTCCEVSERGVPLPPPSPPPLTELFPDMRIAASGNHRTCLPNEYVGFTQLLYSTLLHPSPAHNSPHTLCQEDRARYKKFHYTKTERPEGPTSRRRVILVR